MLRLCRLIRRQQLFWPPQGSSHHVMTMLFRCYNLPVQLCFPSKPCSRLYRLHERPGNLFWNKQPTHPCLGESAHTRTNITRRELLCRELWVGLGTLFASFGVHKTPHHKRTKRCGMNSKVRKTGPGVSASGSADGAYYRGYRSGIATVTERWVSD